ncbi:UNVERIFIED_CONTAM: hypothetical protein HDU68_009832 [Siphonaria sp. JEL0065]|nr:hypothetical protein HDU68_009832 [Siphonaria sp. JEL0065]
MLRVAEEKGDAAVAKLGILSDDFVFNLALLEDRDRDLEAIEREVVLLKDALRERDALVSDLNMRLADSRLDLDNLKAFHSNQDLHHAESIRKLRRDHETAIQEYIQSATQKDQIMNELEITCDLKIKSYTDELNSLRDVDKRLKETQWEFSDYKKQTASELARLKHELQKVGLEYHIKSQLESHKSVVKTFESDLESREADIAALNAKLEKAAGKIRKLVETHDAKIRKLNDKLSSSQKRFDQTLMEMETSFLKEYDSLRNELANKDEQIQKLQNQRQQLNRDLSSCQEEITRRKEMERELKAGLSELSTEKSAIEKKTEEMILRKLKESEKYIKSVLQEKEIISQDFENLKSEFKTLLKDRADLEHRLDEREDAVIDDHETQIAELEQQNHQLRAIVKQMRNDMEAVQNQVVPPHQHQQSHHQQQQEFHQNQSPEFTNFVARDVAIANQQLQQLAEIVHQKQQLIEQLLKSSAQAPVTVLSATTISENHQLSEKLTSLAAENESLKQRVKELTVKVVDASGDRMRLLDMSNALRAEVRMLKGEAKSMKSIETQTIAIKFGVDKKVDSVIAPPPAAAATVAERRFSTNSGAAISSKRSKSAQPSTSSLVSEKGPQIEMERKRRMKGIRNWNEVEDL